MKANDVIEAYIRDVAANLPRAQRDDVARELRALLAEELQARAEGEGVAADADLAVALVRGFGRPAEVAARYRAPSHLIDPADTALFLQSAGIGLAVIWAAGLLGRLSDGVDDAHGGWLGLVGQWWTHTAIPSLWWPGALLACFALAAWMRRRWPARAEWTPRPPDHIPGGRGLLALGLAGVLLGLFVLSEPTRVLDVAFGGRAAPEAYRALTYAPEFRRFVGPLVWLLVALNVPLLLAAIVTGRWSARLRSASVVLSLVVCAAMAWTVLDGPVFLAAQSDQLLKPLLALIVAATLLDLGVKWHRRVQSSP
jgi:hypothetical protein